MAAGRNKAEAELDRLVEGLHARGRLRVWSLAITVFGDAIVPRGGKAGLSVLQAIMERLNIENGALRTAMSRLAADGWVVRERSGRNSIYALAASGRHAFDEATRRIYASGPPAWDGRWTVAISPAGDGSGNDGALKASGFVSAGSNTWLRVESAAAQPLPSDLAGFLVVTAVAAAMPREPGRFWELDATSAIYQALIKRYSPLDAALNKGDRLEPLDAMAARTLLIHDWRRAVLHDPGLPTELLPKDWPGQKARSLARSAYSKLAAASERWLDEAGLPPLSDPTRFAERFGIFQSSR